MSNKTKQSLVAGALTGSAGLFISKFLGLIYAPVLTSMTGGNPDFYAQAYSIYNIILTIASAGLPMALSSLVAKYMLKEDYKTVVLVRKLITSILLSSGFVLAVVVFLFAGQYAKFTSTETDPIYINNYIIVLRIIAIAIFFVPYLSSFRGFYQGLKNMKVYAVSQIIEQVVRVFSMIIFGAFCVYVLRLGSIWAIYMAILAPALAAIVTIFYFKKLDKSQYKEIKAMSNAQQTQAKDASLLLKEMFIIGLPFVVVSILGSSMDIINSSFFTKTLAATGTVPAGMESAIYSMIHFQSNNLTSIPQILGLSFGASVIPYLTISLEKKNYIELRKNVIDSLETVIYIATPLCFCLLALAKPIYYFMYGSTNLDYGATCLAFSSFLAFTGTVSPICSNMMLALRQRKTIILILAVGFAVKTITFFPLMKYTGYTGAITSSILTGFTCIFLSLFFMKKVYQVNYKRLIQGTIFVIIGIVSMYGAFVIVKWCGVNFACTSRLITFVELAVTGVAGVIMYIVTTSFFRLPQRIFKISFTKLMPRGKQNAS